LNETDLKKIEKYFDKESEKNVEEDESIQDGKMVIEKVDELKKILIHWDLIVSIIVLKKKYTVLLLQ